MLEPVDALLLGLPPLFSSSTLAALHWFPWNGGTEQLTRVEAYTQGTLVILGVPIATMLIAYFSGLSRNELFWVGLLIENALISGATVKTAYWIDSKRALTTGEIRNAQHRN